jgi:hypothetical protein
LTPERLHPNQPSFPNFSELWEKADDYSMNFIYFFSAERKMHKDAAIYANTLGLATRQGEGQRLLFDMNAPHISLVNKGVSPPIDDTTYRLIHLLI